jgi:peptide/nickel transport system substrate-binding protein
MSGDVLCANSHNLPYHSSQSTRRREEGMGERGSVTAESIERRQVSRRTLLRLMAAAGSGPVLASFGADRVFAADPAFKVANPKYERFYTGRDGIHANDANWVRLTRPRLTWPEEGEMVPELTVTLDSNLPDQLDAWRKWAADAQKIGLKYDVVQVSTARWLEVTLAHINGDVETHWGQLRPERIDPADYTVSRGYGLDRRNFGEWVNQSYDQLAEAQVRESDPARRLDEVHEAARVLADDMYINQFGWGPSIIDVYNSQDWEGVVQTLGFGIASFDAYHTFLKLKPRTGKRKVVVGMTALLDTTNLIASNGNMRAIGRMIYDRLAYYDADLKVIPWAAESWQRVDERTWDLKLRPGMKFHDGKKVTVHDLQFTFDFMRKFDRGLFWTENRFLDDTSIKDEANGILRIRFKEPYGEFETSFLQLNVILPKHLWENLMQEQGAGDNPRKLRIDKPIGSGPFKFGRYRKDTELQLVADKGHFAAPVIDELWAVATPSVDGLLGRLQSQEIDFIEARATLRPSQAKQLAGSKHLTEVRTTDLNWLHGVPRVSVLPWRDYEFRRAWHHSIDREFLVQVVWEGAGRMPTANTFFVKGSPWYNAALPPVPEFDLDKARAILAAAGYSWAADGRLVYPPPSDAGFRDRVTRVCKNGYVWGGLTMLD